MNSAPATLATVLASVRDSVSALGFILETADADVARQRTGAVVRQIDDYLLPRLQSLEAPLLAVVGGSTGAGKSTLVNSIVESNVSPAGVLRPTTLTPVLVCAEADRPWFDGAHVLPGLARISAVDSRSPQALRLITVPTMPPGLALVDAPDIDSVVQANRELAGQLLAAADLWVFVTTAARYADAVPWELLRDGQDRNVALAVVLNRVPPDAATAVSDDLRAMLARAGLRDVRLFVIEEGPLEGARLPEAQLRPVRDWLYGLAVDAEARRAVVRQTLSGALDHVESELDWLASAVEAQSTAVQELRVTAAGAYGAAMTEFADGLRSGTLLRGEVLARWHDFVGASEWMRSLQSRVGQWRDRLTDAIRGRPSPVLELEEALETSVETLLRAAADRAAERTVIAWQASPGGRTLLQGRERELDRASAAFAAAASSQVRDWQGHVLELVRAEGAGRRTTARFLSLGVNGAGLAVMIAVFAHTGGITGGEVIVAGGTSAVAQKLLEAVFGDAAIRTLAAKARDDLERRADALFAGERERFDVLVAAVAPEPGSAARLREARATLSHARRQEVSV
jgi:hypothetical protein